MQHGLKSINMPIIIPFRLLYCKFIINLISEYLQGKSTYKSFFGGFRGSWSVGGVPMRVPIPGLEIMVSASSEEWDDIGMRYLVRMFFIEWNWLGDGS
jgi:hypothetical protein